MSLTKVSDVGIDVTSLADRALERREMAGLVGAASLLMSHGDLAKTLSTTDAIIWARTLSEAGHFVSAAKLASEIYSSGTANRLEAVPIIATAARRTRRISKVAQDEPLVAATNNWILGDLASGYSHIEVAALAGDSDADLLLTKALILADKGFIGDSAAICRSLESAPLQPITYMEMMGLQIQLDLDARDFDPARFSRFRSHLALPSTTPELGTLLDFLELSIRARLPESARINTLLERLNTHEWVYPHLIQSRLEHEGSPQAQTPRQKTALMVVKAKRTSHQEAESTLRLAIEFASRYDLISPFLEFGGGVRSLICSVASSEDSRFHDRLVDLFSKSEARSEQPLNKRELLIMKLFAAGLSAPEIARDLVISKETVKSHSHHVIRKLGVSSRSEALAILADRGLLSG